MNAVAEATIKGCPQLTQLRLLVTACAPFVEGQDTAQAGLRSVSNRPLFNAGHDLFQNHKV